MKILKKGISDPQVEVVKGFLRDEGYFFGGVHPHFGFVLDNAVKRYQRDKGLTVDGIVGNATYKKFREDGFMFEGNEPEVLGMSSSAVRKIVEQNSHKLIAEPNKYNPNPTAFDPETDLMVVAIRGYNLDMGEKGVNDRRIYDDAHFIVTPEKVIAYEGNTDPNGYREGRGYGSNKGMACLKEGVWFFGKGRHKGSPAFRQCCPFTVVRDGSPPYDHTGYHAINWHSGGVSSTSSLGCQTNRPSDFIQIRDYIYKHATDNPQMRNDWNEKVFAFPYILV